MAKPSGFNPGFAPGFGVGRYYYALAPYVWDTTSFGNPCWRQNPSVVGQVDLRSLPAQATAGGAPQGFAFVASMQPVGVPLVRSLHMSDENATTGIQDAWEAELGYRPQGAKVSDLLWDYLTAGGDPTGASGPKPLRPNSQGNLELFLGGHSLIRRERFVWGRHPHTSRVRDMLRRDFRKCFEANETHARKVLGQWCREHRGVDWRDFVPADLRPHVAGPLVPATTITESFNKADSSTLGPDLTWAEVLGDLQVVSNRCTNVSTNTVTSARAESDLSSANHYSQGVVRTTTVAASTLTSQVAARFASAAETYYAAQVFWVLSAVQQNMLRFFKMVAGTQTILDSNRTVTFNATTDYTIKCECDGDTRKSYVNGSLEHNFTDTAIGSGTRCGVGIYDLDSTSRATVDTFEAADLAAAGYTLTADAGSYAISGTAAGLKAGRMLAANAGSYTITGTAATLKAGRKIAADAGSYAITGTAATLRVGRVLAAGSGSYAITGTAAGLKAGRMLAAAAGSYSFTGQDATLTYAAAGDFTLSAAAGSFAIVGESATLTYTAVAPVVAGTRRSYGAITSRRQHGYIPSRRRR